MPRRIVSSELSVVLALAIGPAAPVAGGGLRTRCRRRRRSTQVVPTAQSVLGFALGTQEVSVARRTSTWLPSTRRKSGRVITGNAADIASVDA